MTRTIFAMGGGGFTMEPDNPALDVFVLELPQAKVPRICFLPTASGDPEAQVNGFYAAFGHRACEPTHLSLFRLSSRPIDVEEHLLAQDVVYAGGGSMRNMLAIWREHRLDAILAEAWRRGTVLAGLSAGAMCWFQGGVTKSGGAPEPVDGIGLLPGSLSVHLDGDPDRMPVYVEAVRSGRLPPGWAAADGVGLLFRGERLERVVTSRPGVGALRVEAGGVTTEVAADELAREPRRGPPADVAEFRQVRGLRR